MSDKIKEIETIIKTLFSQWVAEKEKADHYGTKKIRYAGPKIGDKGYQNILDAIFSDW